MGGYSPYSIWAFMYPVVYIDIRVNYMACVYTLYGYADHPIYLNCYHRHTHGY